MIRIAALVALTFAAGCSKASTSHRGDQAPPESDKPADTPADETTPPAGDKKDKDMPTTSSSTTNGMALSWSMARAQPDKLEITFKVENTSDHKVWVCDSYLVSPAGPNQWQPFPGIAVSPVGEGSDTAKLVVGTPSNELPQKPRSHFLALEPGESFEGSRTVKYPLEGKVPGAGKAPLPSSIDKAQLTVYALDKEPDWAELPSADGAKTYKVPRNFKPVLLTAGPVALP